MITTRLSYLPVALIMGTSLILLVNQNWRQYFLTLAVQYLAVFWLVALNWPVGLAAVKLVVGWMVTAVLGASQWDIELDDEGLAETSGRLFRIFSGGIIWIAVLSLETAFSRWIPVTSPILLGSLFLIGMGLLQLGMHNQFLRVIVGLLTLLSGFEILYSALENSVLVAGLLALINLGLAVTGAYLLSRTSPKELT